MKPNEAAERIDYPVEIDSVPFYKLKYEIIDGCLLIDARKNGKMCLKLKNVRDFAKEIMEIADVYGRR